MRNREKKVSHELKTKRNKVSALRILEEGHDKEQKVIKKSRVEGESKGERRRVSRKNRETCSFFFFCKI